MFKSRIVFVGMVFVCVIISLSTVFYGFSTENERTNLYLEHIGYKDIHITGFRPFGCMRDEGAITRTGFSAKNANGISVTGTVCWEPVWGNYLQLD